MSFQFAKELVVLGYWHILSYCQYNSFLGLSSHDPNFCHSLISKFDLIAAFSSLPFFLSYRSVNLKNIDLLFFIIDCIVINIICSRFKIDKERKSKSKLKLLLGSFFGSFTALENSLPA